MRTQGLIRSMRISADGLKTACSADCQILMRVNCSPLTFAADWDDLKTGAFPRAPESPIRARFWPDGIQLDQSGALDG